MRYEAKGVCKKCGKELVRFWEDRWNRIGAEESLTLINCPFCSDSTVALRVSALEDKSRHNLRSGWSRG